MKVGRTKSLNSFKTVGITLNDRQGGDVARDIRFEMSDEDI